MADHSQLLAQLAALAQSPPEDQATRHQLFAALRQAAFAVESRHDTFHRVASGGLLPAVTKLAVDLKLLKLLAASSSPQSPAQLAAVTKADESLLHRVLRYLAGHDLVVEFPNVTYGPSKTTHMLAGDGYDNGLSYYFNMESRNWMAIPEYFQKKQYQSPKDPTDTPFSIANQTQLPPFVWALGQPERFHEFSQYMAVSDHGWGSWLDVFPKDPILQAGSTPLFVDVGGSIGHVCAELKQRYPQIQREIVLQDLPMVIAQALPTPGVKNDVYDFFTPQPVKGAAFYYFRQILHDWPDEACRKILEMQKEAMDDKHSSILIDELVLPEHGAHYIASTIDMTLMNNAAGIERTQDQWRRLVESCGLVVKAKYEYADVGRSVLVVTKPSA